MEGRRKKRTTRNITGQALENLLNAQDFESFSDDNSTLMRDESFCRYFDELCQRKAIPKSDIIKNSGIERTYAYQIIRGFRKPTRDKVIRIAIGLELNLNETQDLLRISQHGTLYPRIRRDAAIIFCITHNLTYAETQEMLRKTGENLLD